MHIEMKQGMWWVQFFRKYGLLHFIKKKNAMHALAELQKLASYRLWLLNYQN